MCAGLYANAAKFTFTYSRVRSLRISATFKYANVVSRSLCPSQACNVRALTPLS